MTINFWDGTWNGRRPNGTAHNRARNVITPSGIKIRGVFPSRKNGRSVHYEGLLEKDAILLFELSPLIVSYREQPVKVVYSDANKLRKYTPDFEITLLSNKTILTEVKTIRSLSFSEVKHKFDCIKSHFEREQLEFDILTDKYIRHEPRLSNLKYIYDHLPKIISSFESMRSALSYRTSLFPTTIKSAIAEFQGTQVDVFSLLMSGQICCDLNEIVSLETIVEKSEMNNALFQINPESTY
jgi:hypothetical protein